jgi:uncharacterized membrane protein YhaH (DUF805 family)
MGPVTAISTIFAKTFTYSGRASRSEYWWYMLFYFIVCLICACFDTFTLIALISAQGEQALSPALLLKMTSFYAYIMLALPFLSVSVRRLHDAGFSGFWLLAYLIPIGGLVLLVIHVLPSAQSATEYGTPASSKRKSHKGKTATEDAHKRAMQGYALLFDKDKTPTPEMHPARKAEVADYYRTSVLKSAPSA